MKKRTCTLRLTLSQLPDLPPEPVAVEIGIQTKKDAILRGLKTGRSWVFETEIQVLVDDDRIDFKGATVHGGPGARFLYLSWKRQQDAPPFWVQRVKIPLSGAAELLRDVQTPADPVLAVDITGRAPHDVTPLRWSLAG